MCHLKKSNTFQITQKDRTPIKHGFMLGRGKSLLRINISLSRLTFETYLSIMHIVVDEVCHHHAGCI